MLLGLLHPENASVHRTHAIKHDVDDDDDNGGGIIFGARLICHYNLCRCHCTRFAVHDLHLLCVYVSSVRSRLSDEHCEQHSEM